MDSMNRTLKAFLPIKHDPNKVKMSELIKSLTVHLTGVDMKDIYGSKLHNDVLQMINTEVPDIFVEYHLTRC